MTQEEIKNAVETIKIARAEVEWNYSMNYAMAFETAIECMETAAKIPDVIDWLEMQIKSEDSIAQNSKIVSHREFHYGMKRAIENALEIIKEKLCGGTE